VVIVRFRGVNGTHEHKRTPKKDKENYMQKASAQGKKSTASRITAKENCERHGVVGHVDRVLRIVERGKSSRKN